MTPPGALHASMRPRVFPAEDVYQLGERGVRGFVLQ